MTVIKPQNQKRYSQGGVSLTDSMSVIGLITVVAIASLTIFGNDLGKSYDTIKNGFPKEAAKVPSTALNASNALELSKSLNINNSPFTSYASTPSNYTSNLSVSIETSGSNGTTTSLLENLKAQSAYFLSTNQISQSQYNDLMALVQQGYRMAEAQKLIENAIQQSNGDVGILSNTPILFEGKSYPVDELGRMFGLNRYGLGNLLSPFNDKKNSILGQITDPTAKQKITVLTDQVMSVGNAFENSIENTLNGNRSNTNSILTDTASMDALNELYSMGVVNTQWNTPLPLPPSSLTNNNSNSLCNINASSSAQCNAINKIN